MASRGTKRDGTAQLMKNLGLSDNMQDNSSISLDDEEAAMQHATGYMVVPNPDASTVDLSELRGVGSHDKMDDVKLTRPQVGHELDNLAELVPDLKTRRSFANEAHESSAAAAAAAAANTMGKDSAHRPARKRSMQSGGNEGGADSTRPLSAHSDSERLAETQQQRMMVLPDGESVEVKASGGGGSGSRRVEDTKQKNAPAVSTDVHQDRGGRTHGGVAVVDDVFANYPGSDEALEDTNHDTFGNDDDDEANDDMGPVPSTMPSNRVPKEFLNISSVQSLSTATHDVRMPMYLPTFKPATGCTNASDFIVRCFVARLRSGITVVKHGRSRWCKSRLRILHIHPDGRSLSWKPAEGEPVSSRRPPKLDLSACLEVRHAWSPDPQNPLYTGTPILRQKCEAANAHKSFALIFKSRTVDITAVTADQCKVLMEGFSALCFRLQVANLASNNRDKTGGAARPMPEEDGVSTTASNTLTNSSTPRNR